MRSVRDRQMVQAKICPTCERALRAIIMTRRDTGVPLACAYGAAFLMVKVCVMVPFHARTGEIENTAVTTTVLSNRASSVFVVSLALVFFCCCCATSSFCVFCSVKMFRPDENAKRIRASAERILMEPPPAELFIKACKMAVRVSFCFVRCAGVCLRQRDGFCRRDRLPCICDQARLLLIP